MIGFFAEKARSFM